MYQRTIAAPVRLSGIGLHSGKLVQLVFSPAPSDTGIVFYRSDLADAQPIASNYRAIKDTTLSSNLVNEAGQRVGTVEHLMSAIAALGIDNLRIDISAPETPIMDGSALPFIEALQSAGISEQPGIKRFVKILRPVEVKQGDKWAKLEPAKGFSIDFKIDFDHPAIPSQHQQVTLDFGKRNFIEQIARARTFGFLKDIEYLKTQNLGLGGSMDNAIVLDDKTVLNPDGLRFADEFTRHKILDAVGDLYLAGHQIIGAFSAFKSGHALNNQLLHQVFSDSKNFEIVTNYDENSCLIDYLT